MRTGIKLTYKADSDILCLLETNSGYSKAQIIRSALNAYLNRTAPLPLVSAGMHQQKKSLHVSLSLNDTRDRLLIDYLNTLPDKMTSIYIKGIVRMIYGASLYKTYLVDTALASPIVQASKEERVVVTAPPPSQAYVAPPPAKSPEMTEDEVLAILEQL